MFIKDSNSSTLGDKEMYPNVDLSGGLDGRDSLQQKSRRTSRTMLRKLKVVILTV